MTKDAGELRRALAILLPADHGSTLEETASTLGVGRSTVPRLQAEFRNNLRSSGAVVSKRSRWGGRRRALLSEKQECAFLERHGWRKIAPDTRHPKSDPRVQEEWKKNSRKIWLPS